MASHPNIYRRPSGVYVIRLCVPRELQPLVGKTEVHRSTGIRDLELAKICAADLIALWRRQLHSLKHMDPQKVVAGSLDLLGDGFIPMELAATALGSTVARLASDLLEAGAPVFVDVTGIQGWLLDDAGALDHRDETGLVEIDVSQPNLRQHGREHRGAGRVVVRIESEVTAIVKEGHGQVCSFRFPRGPYGFVVPFPGMVVTAEQLEVRKGDVEALRARLALGVTPEMLAHLPIGAAPAARGDEAITSSRHAGMKVSALTKLYLERNRATWQPNTLHTNSDHCNALIELSDDAVLDLLDRDALWKIADQLKRLPANRQQVRIQHHESDATLRRLIELADQHELPRLTAAATRKIVGGFGKLFQWGVDEQYLRTNPVKGLAERVFSSLGGRKTRAIDARDTFTKDDLELVFGALWFRAGTGARTKAGVYYEFRPYYYWLPLLGLYSGGRITELSQLYLSDFRVSPKGHHFIDFNLDGEGKVVDVEDKKLKTVNAGRSVPLHSHLVQLGLLDYVEALRRAGHLRLFPELKFDRVKGYGKASGRWFNDTFLGRQLAMVRDGRKTFHSLRHTFATALGGADVSTSTKAQLLGHERSSELADKVYDKGKAVDQLKPAIDRLDFALPPIAKFDIAAGIQAVADAVALKGAHRRRSAKSHSAAPTSG